MSTHLAVATVGLKAPLGLIQVPTITPTGEQIRVRVEWTASTPLDLHQNDGGLLVSHPQILGDGTAGTVVEVGPDVRRLKVGDKVFGFTWRSQAEKAHQEYCTAEEWLFALLPEGFTLAETVTLPNNFVTVFHTLTQDLSLLEMDQPSLSTLSASGNLKIDWHAQSRLHSTSAPDSPILVWGGSSSVGQFAIQILRYYGYTNVLTTASHKHHERLRGLGASNVFDYNDPDIASSILREAGDSGISFIFDCIGSKYGSIAPISQIAQKDAEVAILLPIIVRDSTEEEDPEYEMDVEKAAKWQEGVQVRGVRTHFYLNNEFFKYHLQPDIMHTMLKQRIVEPQKQKVVEGATLLERAQEAMNMLRKKQTSMERLVWRVGNTE